MEETNLASSKFRLRLGVFLFVLSWFPFAQIILFIAHNNGKLTSSESSQKFRLTVWAIQFIIGFIGIWLAGSIAIQAAKKDGWKHTPKYLWLLLRHGS